MDKTRIYVLDGGFSMELEKCGYTLNNDPLWTSRILYTNPSAVVDVHKRFLESGSDIITTCSYQASIDGFQKYLGTTVEDSKQLIMSSVKLAKQAREDFLKSSNKDKDIIIAGSVGPYGAALADGSEYTGTYCDHITHEELVQWHRTRVECLVNAGADLLAMETIPAEKEAVALMKVIRDFPSIKVWLSFSCQSANRTCHGEQIGKAVKNVLKIAPTNQIIAVGVNCCPPQYVNDLLKDISKNVTEFPLIAYPNSGETYISQVGWINNKEKPLHSYVNSWIENSATYIGGCCRTGAEDIAQVVKQLQI